MELQTPSDSSILPLIPPLGSLCSVSCLAAIFHICIGPVLAEPLWGQWCEAPVYKHFLYSMIVPEFGGFIWDRWLGGSVYGEFSFSPCFKLCASIYFRQEQIWIKICEISRQLHHLILKDNFTQYSYERLLHSHCSWYKSQHSRTAYPITRSHAYPKHWIL